MSFALCYFGSCDESIADVPKGRCRCVNVDLTQIFEYLFFENKVKLYESQRHSANVDKRIHENVRGGGGIRPLIRQGCVK